MTNILITNGHLNAGGVEKSLVNLLRSVDYERFNVDLLLFEGLGDYKTQISPKVRIINWDLTDTYGSIWEVTKRAFKQKNLMLFILKLILILGNKCDMRLLKLLRVFRKTASCYDYAIAYRVGMSADYISYVANAKIKAIWWHNGKLDYTEKTIKHWAAEFDIVDRVVCVSEFAKRLITTVFPNITKKTLVIPNFINIEEIQTYANKFDPYAGLHEAVILVSVGRFSSEKHMIDCAYVAKRLKDEKYNFKWYLVGDGGEREKIEKKIAEYGLTDSVLLTGIQENPYPFIKNADIFVHPSYVESQGIVVLEAMSLGKLCVVVRSGGTAEFVRDNVNAIQAEPTIDSLYEKVRIAIESSFSFSKAAMHTAEMYTSEIIMGKIYELME